MKKYYYHDGQNQVGPFDLEELKQKGIQKQTMIWYEGMENWQKAENMPELKDILPIAPPPMLNSTPPPMVSNQAQIQNTSQNINQNNQNTDNRLYVSSSILNNLPSMVRNELSMMSPQKQEEFVEEYKRKSKSIGVGYLFLLLIFATHYGYVNKWGLQVLFWLTGGGGRFETEVHFLQRCKI